MSKLTADPKRWIKLTAPLSASLDSSPTGSFRTRVSTRCKTCRTGVSNAVCDATNNRSGIDSDGDSTQWRARTFGVACSTR